MSQKKSYGLAAAALSIAMGGSISFGSSTEAGAGKKGHGHEDQHMDHKTDSHTGHDHTGSITDVSRTIQIIVKDAKFNLQEVQVKEGETIRFVVRNTSDLVHEFTIGTRKMQKMHQVLMQKMLDAGPSMMDKVMGEMAGHSAVLEPEQEKEIIWTFPKGAKLEFGCSVPGHYKAGMKGEFVIGGSS